MGLPQIVKYVFQLVGYFCDILIHHNTRRSLYGMHDTENLIDGGFIKTIFVLFLQHSILEVP